MNLGLFPAFTIGISLFLFSCSSGGMTPTMEKKVGESVPQFSLATSQDSLFNYDKDLYGKHHLILTFFPAAFTPV